METTSHFIWIEIKSEIISNIFVETYKYLKKNNIENSILFQNPISSHITLYYLEKDINKNLNINIKNYIKKLKIDEEIKISWFNYFFKLDWSRNILYFTIDTKLNLNDYNNDLDKIYNRALIEDNNFNFLPHITFLRIKDNKIFEEHKENIENIINIELLKINNFDLNSKNIFLYASNSNFKEEIQIKI